MGVIATITRRESHGKTDKKTRKDQILTALKAGPMTARCVMQALGYSDLNSVRPRLTELVQEGLVAEAGAVWDPVSQRNVVLYALEED
ncbi:hypothetical protein [Candidatus Allofournierella merdipullorum]|uniref:hypothetical protein n=1 Tax=Candidatus Allofournierella merdipullorum TaxID=2838595 RepID=UPI002A8DF1E4|nr:hypothetical protein [Candidatus Fournierella merdipullorum]